MRLRLLAWQRRRIQGQLIRQHLRALHHLIDLHVYAHDILRRGHLRLHESNHDRSRHPGYARGSALHFPHCLSSQRLLSCSLSNQTLPVEGHQREANSPTLISYHPFMHLVLHPLHSHRFLEETYELS